VEASLIEILTIGEMLVEIMRPRAGMPLHEAGEFLGPYPSGAPVIFIDTVARLGHASAMIGAVGEDDFGRCLTERLHADGVDLKYVQTLPHRATAVAFVTYFEDGSRKFIFHIDGTPAVMARFSADAASERPRYFHVMGCSLMAKDSFRAEIFKAVKHFYALGTRISFDPNIRPELLGERSLIEVTGPVLERAAILIPGEAELRHIGGDEEIDRSIEKLFRNPTLELIALKRGRNGARIYTRQTMIETPAYRVTEVDPTGAGDCFDAGFLCGLLEGRPLAECGRIAAAAGALNASAFGPMEGKISPESVWELMQSQP
jgi:sugar/nucleoside kinase (ribokinase family)